jgi:hypothetical protein
MFIAKVARMMRSASGVEVKTTQIQNFTPTDDATDAFFYRFLILHRTKISNFNLILIIHHSVTRSISLQSNNMARRRNAPTRKAKSQPKSKATGKRGRKALRNIENAERARSDGKEDREEIEIGADDPVPIIDGDRDRVGKKRSRRGVDTPEVKQVSR